MEDDLGRFLARLRIPFFTTQMGKGFSSQVMEDAGAGAHPIDLWMGTAALSERDYVHTAIDQADLIITTEKDAMRLAGREGPSYASPGPPHESVGRGFTPRQVAYLPMHVVIEPAASFSEWITERLREARLRRAAEAA